MMDKRREKNRFSGGPILRHGCGPKGGREREGRRAKKENREGKEGLSKEPPHFVVG